MLGYEGAPDYPQPDRLWSMIEKYGVTVFYTAPTAIRMFIQWGEEWPKKHNLNSLRILGIVGEPINEEAWLWYFYKIGGGRCPVIDTWWQTETGGTLINSLPGIGPFIPTVAGRSFPGTWHDVLDESGNPMTLAKADTWCRKTRSGQECLETSGETRRDTRNTSAYTGKNTTTQVMEREDGMTWGTFG